MHMSVIYTLVAIFLYGLQSVLVEQKLSHCSTFGILIIIQAVLLLCTVLTVLFIKSSGEIIIYPSGKALWIAIICGLLYYIGNYFFFGAYTVAKGDVYNLAIVAGLYAVIVFSIKAISTGIYPNWYQLCGCVLATFSVWLVSKGL